MNPLPTNVLITGGSSGLGAACVDYLSQQGVCGVIADRQPPRVPLSAEASAPFLFHNTDVTDETALSAAIDLACERFGPLRAAIACAGVLHAERILTRAGPANLVDFRRVIDINLVGTFNLLRLAAERMKQQEPSASGERGVIVMTASIAACDGQIGQAAYAAAKGGVASLVLPAARELGKWGIRVVAIAPGVFDTPMMQAAAPELRDSLIAETPFPHRFGQGEEFAALVAQVLTNPMLNGTVLRLDGGLRLGMH